MLGSKVFGLKGSGELYRCVWSNGCRTYGFNYGGLVHLIGVSI